MSMTQEIACLDCGESYWCGQGTREQRLYSLERLQAFLLRHQSYYGTTHRLVYYFDETEPECVLDENGIPKMTRWKGE